MSTQGSGHWFTSIDEAIAWLAPFRSTTFDEDEKDALCDAALMLADEVDRLGSLVGRLTAAVEIRNDLLGRIGICNVCGEQSDEYAEWLGDDFGLPVTDDDDDEPVEDEA